MAKHRPYKPRPKQPKGCKHCRTFFITTPACAAPQSCNCPRCKDYCECPASLRGGPIKYNWQNTMR